jgi:tetratricopeptide (TPR) repeat protein
LRIGCVARFSRPPSVHLLRLLMPHSSRKPLISGIVILCGICLTLLVAAEASAFPFRNLRRFCAARCCRAPDRANIAARSSAEPDPRQDIAEYNEELKRTPNDGRLLILRGAAYVALYIMHPDEKYWNRAHDDFTRAVELLPNSADARERYADHFYLKERWAEAASAYQRAIDLGGDDVDLFIKCAQAYSGAGDSEQAGELFTRAIDSAPSNVDGYLHRGAFYRGRGDFDKAIADYDTAIRLEPKVQWHFVDRAFTNFDARHDEAGIEDMWAAIRFNPNDAGLSFEVDPETKLSPEAIKHGEEQIRQMLSDRPRLAELVTEGDALWNWVVRQFAGEGYGQPVFWDGTDEMSGFGAETRPIDELGQIGIMIANDEQETAERLLRRVIFELNNAGNWSEFQRIYDAVRRGQGVSRQEFNLQNMRGERRSVQRTRAFYLKLFLPLMNSRGVQTSPAEWFCDSYLLPGDDEAIAYAKADLHWQYYSFHYDLLTVEADYTNRRFCAARAMLDCLAKKRSALSPGLREVLRFWENEFAKKAKGQSQ